MGPFWKNTFLTFSFLTNFLSSSYVDIKHFPGEKEAREVDLCHECTSCICFPRHTLDFSCDVLENYGSDFCQNFICKHNITCPTVSTTIQTTTTPPLPVTCNKTSIITAVALNQPVGDPSTSACPDTTFQSPESLLTNYCGIPLVSNWKQGQKVIDECHSNPNSTLSYTPVSTIAHGHHDIMSGIFIRCISGGFSMIAQTCTTTPSVLNITHGSLYHLPDFRFVLS